MPYGFAVNWAVLTPAFLASLVEFVEAFTIVLVVGVTINWKSTLLGTGLALGALAIIVGTLGTAIVVYVPINILRLIVGVLLVLFGLKWLKKAILRSAGLMPIYDEEAKYEQKMASMRARGQAPDQNRLDPFGVVTSFKGVLLEGLEVAFIVITFGGGTSTGAGGKGNSISSAAIGAVAAFLIITAIVAIIRAPLSRVPENTLKFVVGIMLTAFGTFWGGEGIGINWWHQDFFIVILVALYLAMAGVYILWLKPVAKEQAIARQAAETAPSPQAAQPRSGLAPSQPTLRQPPASAIGVVPPSVQQAETAELHGEAPQNQPRRRATSERQFEHAIGSTNERNTGRIGDRSRDHTGDHTVGTAGAPEAREVAGQEAGEPAEATLSAQTPAPTQPAQVSRSARRRKRRRSRKSAEQRPELIIHTDEAGDEDEVTFRGDLRIIRTRNPNAAQAPGERRANGASTGNGARANGRARPRGHRANDDGRTDTTTSPREEAVR